VCVAVEGRCLEELTVPALRAAAIGAEEEGLDAVFLMDGPLGDAAVLAAGLTAWTTTIAVGVLVRLEDRPHRHPSVLARELTTLDLVGHGRAILGFMAPFDAGTGAAVSLCREMWRQGTATNDGPHYPVAGAINRPGPHRQGGPPIVLAVTDGATVPPDLVSLVDYLLVPSDDDRDLCLLQPT